MPAPAPWFAALWVFFTLGGVVLLTLLVLTIRTYRGFKRTLHPCCRKCRYMLIDGGGPTGRACPECGSKKKPITRKLSGRQLGWRCVAIPLLLALLIHCFGSTAVWYRMNRYPASAREDWYEAVTPTTVLIALMPWSDEEWISWTGGRLYWDGPKSSFYVSLDYLPKWKAELLAWACNRNIDRLLHDEEAEWIVKEMANWLAFLAQRPDSNFDHLIAMLDSGDEARVELAYEAIINNMYPVLKSGVLDDALIRALVRRMADSASSHRSYCFLIIQEFVNPHRLVTLGLIPDLLAVDADIDADGVNNSEVGEILNMLGTTDFEEHTQTYFQILVDLLKHPHPTVRVRAVRCLWNLEAIDNDLIAKAIWTVVESDVPKVREVALEALQYITPNDERVIALATKVALDDEEDKRNRVHALIGLELLKRMPKAGIPVLLDALGDDDVDVRRMSYLTLISAEVAKTTIASRLRALLTHDDKEVAAFAKSCLERLGDVEP